MSKDSRYLAASMAFVFNSKNVGVLNSEYLGVRGSDRQLTQLERCSPPPLCYGSGGAHMQGELQTLTDPPPYGCYCYFCTVVTVVTFSCCG